jgi:hypothetical protein
MEVRSARKRRRVVEEPATTAEDRNDLHHQQLPHSRPLRVEKPGGSRAEIQRCLSELVKVTVENTRLSGFHRMVELQLTSLNRAAQAVATVCSREAPRAEILAQLS